MALSRDPDETALDGVFEQIRRDYYSLLKKVEEENEKAKAELEDKLVVDKNNFLVKQEIERGFFEAKLSREKVEFELKQDEEKRKVEMEAAQRREQVASFIKSVRSSNSMLSKSQMPMRTEREIRDEFVCPVCFSDMKPPTQIFQCIQGHPICQQCKSRSEITRCPTCREKLVGRAIHIEKIAGKVFMDNVNESKKDFSRTYANHDSEMQVFIRVNGKTIILNIKPSDSVDDVKELIFRKVGIPSVKQWLVFGGKLLEGSKVMAYFGIEKESTIHVNVRQ